MLAISTKNRETSSGPLGSKTFYGTFGTRGCSLNCNQERDLDQTLTSITPGLARRQKRANKITYLQDLDQKKSWFNADDIENSAAQGCGSCRQFCIFLESLFGDNGHVSPKYEYFISHNFEIWARLPESDDGDAMKIRIFQARGSDTPFQRMYEANLLCGKEVSMKRLHKWLDECSNTHQLCSQLDQAQDDTLPARLIDVSPNNIKGKQGVRLIETSSGYTYRYICLSHRWPTTPLECRTTMDNFLPSLEFLDLERFPANFQDAVTIAQELGIQFLWIDSLCIIQEGDNKEDWLKESAKMESIYQNAYLTIAAVWSPDSFGGCFSREDCSDVRFELVDPAGSLHVLGARILDKKGQVRTESDGKNSYPLLTRGWVFQERLLSRRLLYCYKGEFSFECLERSHCECGCSNLPPHPKILGPMVHWLRGANISHRVQLRRPPTNDRTEASLRWREMVRTYMQLNLTYGTDILPAIAGCAKAMSPRLGYQYVAGMWKESLARDLLWYILPEKYSKPKSRNSKWTAPSWSWASVQTGQHLAFKSFARRNGLSTIDFLLRRAITEVKCEPRNAENPYGSLDPAFCYLKLDATLFLWYIRYFCGKQRHSGNSRNQKNRDFDIHQTRPTMPIVCSGGILELDVEDSKFDFSPDSRIDDEELSVQPLSGCKSEHETCGLAQIYLLHAMESSRRGTRNDVFLVLKRIPPVQDKQKCYRRIGIVQVLNDQNKRQIWFDQIQNRGGVLKEEIWLF